jgi:hypothetical protein
MQQLGVSSGHRAGDGAPVLKKADAAGEFVRLMPGEGAGLVTGAVDDLHRAREHDEEDIVFLPDPEQRLAIPAAAGSSRSSLAP